MKSTNVGGRVPAWVAKSTRGARPPRTGCGVACTTAVMNWLSWPVGYPLLPTGQRLAQGGRELLDRAAGLGGDVDPDRPRDAPQFPLDLLVEEVAAVVVDEVPLVEGEDEGPAGLGDHRQHALVLLADRLAGVDQHDGDLGRLDGAGGAQAGVVLGAAGGDDPPAQAGGVDEQPRLAADR